MLEFTTGELADLEALRKRMPLDYAGSPLQSWIIAMVGYGFDAMADDEQVYEDE